MNSDKNISENDELSFMNDLLAGIDGSFFDATPSPNPSPRKVSSKSTQGATKQDCLYRSEEIRGKASDHDLDVLLEGAEDWDWDDMENEFKSKATSSVGLVDSFRCVVDAVSMRGIQKILNVSSEDGVEQKTVTLLDDWVDTDICIGDTLNLIGPFSSTSRDIVVSARQNLLILHPDILVTATSVANASHCSRKPLLQMLMKPLSDVSPSLLWGNILHETVQQYFSQSRWDIGFISSLLDTLVEERLLDLVRLGINSEQAKEELKRRAVGIVAFGTRYVGNEPKNDAIIESGHRKSGQQSFLAITKLLGIEEDIWTPKYGLKGKVDVTVEACLEDRAVQKGSHNQQVLAFGRSSTRIPFEIKTGQSIAGIEHRAQTALYSLLLEDRYHDAPSGSANTMTAQGGLLYYTQTNQVNYVTAGRNEIRGLIMTRNELARYLVNRTNKSKRKTKPAEAIADGSINHILPKTIDQERACGRCYVSDACMLYRKAVEGVEDDASSISVLYQLKTGHLTPSQLAFFKEWENLITLEENDILRFRKELWTLGSKEREKRGRCFANMALDPSYRIPPRKSGKETRIHQFTYGFFRHEAAPSLANGVGRASQYSPSLLTGHITVGDAVTVSVDNDPHLVALARGFVLELTADRIVIGVDSSLSYESICTKSARYNCSSDVVFRIDKDEMAGGMTRIRDNLAQLFYATGEQRRLELLVDLRAPKFSEGSDVPDGFCTNLNEGQRHAIKHVLNAKDYALILGMPGTGKTTTVAELICILVAMGKTVLLTSYTHSAVDTILLKLKNKCNFDVLRLGNEDKIHPDVLEYTVNAKGKPSSVEQLEDRLLKPPVVATTALSIDHALFSRRRFDYCIVDEASQITLPSCLGPLRFAKKFVLVGDHFQLPPLVRNRDARQAGFDVSLFRRLSDAHPRAVVDLALQYRMNEDIMFLSNKLIYNGRLECGSAEVAASSLYVPIRRKLQAVCNSCSPGCWLSDLLQEDRKAVFVNTDRIPALDSRVGDLIQNKTEASLVQLFTEALIKGGVKEDQIGIISLYRQQIKLLSSLLEPYKGIEILTADRSQGRDKDCIIISLVRANDNNEIGDLLKDWRRINVALTRARFKVVIFGSKKTLKASPLLEEFFNIMEERNWVVTLCPGAEKCYCEKKVPQVPAIASQISQVGTKKRTLQDMGFSRSGQKKENADLNIEKKVKKARLGDAFVRSRPLLRDVMNNAK